MLMFLYTDADAGRRRKLLWFDNGLTLSSRPTEKKMFKIVKTIPVQLTETRGKTTLLLELNIVDIPSTLICQASTSHYLAV